MTIGLLVLTSAVNITYIDLRMNSAEIFQILLMQKIFPASFSRAAWIQQRLPKSIIALFIHSSELSVRSGESLYKAFTGKDELLKQQTDHLHQQKKTGVIFDADELIGLLAGILKDSYKEKSTISTQHQFFPRASALYKGNKVILNLDRCVRLPPESIVKIEYILRELQQNPTV